ncbi:MAG: HAMP domain-containing protein [Planctomycetes bacterium]|nr:HAMP domain-containing protein [Planctomycetota bacterium]
MAESLFRRFYRHYILLIMLLTRLSGSIGGLLVIYYVELALSLPWSVRYHFRITAVIVVIIACTLTVFLALWETRTLRRVLPKLRRGETPPPDELTQAAHEAIVFAGRHHRHESWLVPCTTWAPVLIVLRILDNASFEMLLNISLAVFMGTSMALMATFFALEAGMRPVVRYVLDHGACLDHEALPKGRLRVRFGVCSTLIIMTTALMISTLAIERTSAMVHAAPDQAEAVRSLISHAVYITIAAVVTGVVYSQLLSNSVASRAANLVKAMESVAGGRLSARLRPTGNDEIDRLTHQFNTMVERLEHNHHTIQDLNVNLEKKVRQRTQEVEEALQELRDTQSQMTDMAHRAGMAEIATGVLHNVGNVLNSLNVSANCVEDRLRRSKLNELRRFTNQLAERRGRLREFLSADDRAEKVLDYLSRLCQTLEAEQKTADEELSCVTEKIGVIRGIISTQQSYARRVRFREQVDVARLIEEVLNLDAPLIRTHGVKVVADFQERPVLCLEKSNLVQVVENLVKNAVESMAESDSAERVLTVRLKSHGPERVRVEVADSGRGIPPENLEKIFTYGFTTKPHGSGFGLHSSALAISAIGGAIHVHSEGVGRGATFAVDLPLTAEDQSPAEPDSPALSQASAS